MVNGYPLPVLSLLGAALGEVTLARLISSRKKLKREDIRHMIKENVNVITEYELYSLLIV